MLKTTCHIVFTFLCVPFYLAAQTMPSDEAELAQKYSFISPVHNRIVHNNTLEPFYKKLQSLKSGNGSIVSIVHIGDSHIQADFLSGVVRNDLQEFFGNAGRGLVFPYQLARSNSPDDISSSSTSKWQFNRLAHPEIPVEYGISGHGIQSTASDVYVNLSLRSTLSPFSRLKFFMDSSSWMLQAENNDSSYLLVKKEGELFHEIQLEQAASHFSLSSQPSATSKSFFGVSLENAQTGILYHTIGVNGARYDHFNRAELFWQQLPALKADLYIISLGTNEAQNTRFAEASFHRELSLFLQKLKQASPDAAILITTAADSYRGRRFNAVLRQLNTSLARYCENNRIASWDLYRVTNGYGSASHWSRRGLMTRDRIHFTPDGYRLQGKLLLAAIAKGYNDFKF